MYVNPFWAGVACTLWVEVALVIALIINSVIKFNKI